MSWVDERYNIAAEEYIASIDDEVARKDAQVLFNLMRRMGNKESFKTRKS